MMGIPRTIGDSSYTVVGPPTISANFINSILKNSPAKGTGQALYQYGIQYNIDPVYALAFFQHESTFGTKGKARENLSLGNITCSSNGSNYTCNNRFRKYTSWVAGYEDWYQLIRNFYVNVEHRTTVEQIVIRYAPPLENDVQAYVNAVERSVDRWRAENHS